MAYEWLGRGTIKAGNDRNNNYLISQKSIHLDLLQLIKIDLFLKRPLITFLVIIFIPWMFYACWLLNSLMRYTGVLNIDWLPSQETMYQSYHDLNHLSLM